VKVVKAVKALGKVPPDFITIIFLLVSIFICNNIQIPMTKKMKKEEEKNTTKSMN
jgi:putative exporter of polyketide antibiotics